MNGPKRLSRQQVRDVDQVAIERYGMSGLVLMENAGRGCVDVLLSLGCRGPVELFRRYGHSTTSKPAG